MPERFEASITTLENTKDLSKKTLVELECLTGTGARKTDEGGKDN